MKRVGRVVRVAQGLAIIRSHGDECPKIGTPVVDQTLSNVGRVVDVFGPTERPYLAVTPKKSPATLLGTVLYAR